MEYQYLKGSSPVQLVVRCFNVDTFVGRYNNNTVLRLDTSIIFPDKFYDVRTGNDLTCKGKYVPASVNIPKSGVVSKGWKLHHWIRAATGENTEDPIEISMELLENWFKDKDLIVMTGMSRNFKTTKIDEILGVDKKWYFVHGEYKHELIKKVIRK